METKIELPISKDEIKKLSAGDRVLISGELYTARDQAHLRLINLIKEDKPLPIPIKDTVIYYVGPTPAMPGNPIGSAGPTTSSRMDPFTPTLHRLGLAGTIGKGPRDQSVIDSLIKDTAVYFIAIGGAGAYLANRIKSCEVVAFEDLGPESIKKLTLDNFPVITAIDCRGNSLFF